MKPINGAVVTVKIWAIFNQAQSIKACRGKLSPVQQYVDNKYWLFQPDWE